MSSLPRSPNLDVSMENDTLCPSEENPNLHDIGSNDSDMTDVQFTSQIPSSHQHSVAFQTPTPTEPRINISFLCNPNDEELELHQPSISELFGDNLSSVQKQSWAKDSTCEQIHLTEPV